MTNETISVTSEGSAVQKIVSMDKVLYIKTKSALTVTFDDWTLITWFLVYHQQLITTHSGNHSERSRMVLDASVEGFSYARINGTVLHCTDCSENRTVSRAALTVPEIVCIGNVNGRRPAIVRGHAQICLTIVTWRNQGDTSWKWHLCSNCHSCAWVTRFRTCDYLDVTHSAVQVGAFQYSPGTVWEH